MSEKMKIENLSLYYGKDMILDHINCTLEKNSISAIMGTSGSGKSTFLRCLNRMNDYEENCQIKGKVFLDGANIYDKGYDILKLRSKVGMVFQKPNPFYGSIYKNLSYGPKLFNVKNEDLEQNITNSLNDVSLFEEVKDKMNENAYNLSGGQQQRLCIARAIAIYPDVLLMDEPCSALDPLATQAIEKLIIKLKKKYTIVMITHSVKQAINISDSIFFFHQGKLVELNKTEDFFRTTKNPIVLNYYSSYAQ